MLPDGFAYLDEAVPGALWDAKYAGNDNFLGRPADGYRVNRVVCAQALAGALRLAEAAAEEKRLRILAYDAYRPARAVRDFCRWVREPDDGKTKAAHYPNTDKARMLELGYIAEQSGHSRGCTIDLTLARPDGTELDMGGIFDLMDERSRIDCALISPSQRENRNTLNALMRACGFREYAAEWWHFTLIREAYPDRYFDFPIE